VFRIIEKNIIIMPVEREEKRMEHFLLFGNHSSKQKRAKGTTNDA
jgi:hypothetical protein